MEAAGGASRAPAPNAQPALRAEAPVSGVDIPQSSAHLRSLVEDESMSRQSSGSGSWRGPQAPVARSFPRTRDADEGTLPSTSSSSSASLRGSQSRRAARTSDSDSGVERTKSTSSTSSVNSSSSIEAVPFRAPPRGNLRASGGVGAGPPPRVSALQLAAPDAPGAPSWSVDGTGASPAVRTPQPSDSGAVSPTEASTPTDTKPAPPMRGAVSRMKYPVKPANDMWIFRNGPGLSGVRRSPMLAPVHDDGDAAVPPLRTPSGYHGRAAPPIDAAALAASSGRRHMSRPSSRASYRSRRSETARDASSILSGTTEQPVGAAAERSAVLAEDETGSLASGSSHTSLVRPVALPADVLAMTPAEHVRMEAQAGVARLPDNPGHTTDAEERGQWRARMQNWVQTLNTPAGDAPPPTGVPTPSPPDADTADATIQAPRRRDTTGSQLSDWTTDTLRLRGSDRSSISTVQPRSPSPYEGRTDGCAAPSGVLWPPGWGMRPPSALRASPLRDVSPARSAPAADSAPIARPSISAQMGHHGHVESTTEMLNAGVSAAQVQRRDPRQATVHDASEARAGHARQATVRRRTPGDFVFGEVLGEGSYSTVLKAWDVHDLPESERAALVRRPTALEAVAGSDGAAQLPGGAARAYAVKVLDKVHILKEKKQKYVRVEKEALSLLLHRAGIVTLYYTFQDRESLYFVLELAPKGEFLHYVQKLGTLDTTSAVFYAAELADAIEGIHEAGVIHRDIKPENMLLDAHMRILVTDFGSAKILARPTGAPDGASATDVSLAGRAHAHPSSRSDSFVGTAEYVSPELLGEKSAGMASDWWAFGCVVYQMLAGHSPFKATNEYQTFQRILQRQFTYPPAFPAAARELIDRILVLDPDARPDAAAIKGAAFFAETDFASIWTSAPPPMRPGLAPRQAENERTYSDGLRDLETSFDSLQRYTTQSFSSNPTHSMSGGDDASVSSSDETRASSAEQRVPPAAYGAYARRAVHRPAVPSAAGSSFVAEMYDDLMLPKEDVTYMSPIVLRRTGAGNMFSKRCQLLLTTYPRLLCVRESTRSLRVLGEVILRPIPREPDTSYQQSDTHLVLDRPEPRRGSLRQPRSHSLRSQPSLPALPLQSMHALSRGLSRMGPTGTPSNALTRFASTGARAENKPCFGISSDANTPSAVLPREPHTWLRHPHTSDSRFANWLLNVEVRPPRGFVVHTVRAIAYPARTRLPVRRPCERPAVLGAVHPGGGAAVCHVAIIAEATLTHVCARNRPVHAM